MLAAGLAQMDMRIDQPRQADHDNASPEGFEAKKESLSALGDSRRTRLGAGSRDSCGFTLGSNIAPAAF
jgi:hypothetical protein